MSISFSLLTIVPLCPFTQSSAMPNDTPRAAFSASRSSTAAFVTSSAQFDGRMILYSVPAIDRSTPSGSRCDVATPGSEVASPAGPDVCPPSPAVPQPAKIRKRDSRAAMSFMSFGTMPRRTCLSSLTGRIRAPRGSPARTQIFTLIISRRGGLCKIILIIISAPHRYKS